MSWCSSAHCLNGPSWDDLRNRANLTTTLLEAPALALLVSFVLRYAEEGTYRFHQPFICRPTSF